MADLLTGKVEPFNDPIAYGAAQGADLYFPFPYRKGLKVTAEGTRGLYYHVGYRTYASNTPVETFTSAAVAQAKTKIASTMKSLSAGSVNWSAANSKLIPMNLRLLPNDSVTSEILGNGGLAIRELTVRVPNPLVRLPIKGWTDPHQPHNILRKILLEISFDGVTTVRAPLGDFFSTAPGLNKLESLPFSVTPEGSMTCRFVMPFQKNARITFKNLNTIRVPIQVNVVTTPYKFTKNTYTFHADWRVDHGPTRPMRDMSFLNAAGDGLYVGCNLHVTNPTPAWWGEGDEKFYVDGESFPSTFGTGTEDFFGYAWCSPILFQKPYHAQTRCDGPGNMGQTFVMRSQIFDPIPFTSKLRFDLEMWHWENVDSTFSHTAYWYGRPGKTALATINPADLEVREILPPAPVKGALEGEDLPILSCSGGNTQKQDGFWQLSAGKQLWWTDAKVGDELVIAFPVKKAGRYEVFANMCHAGDYGIHEISINGQPPVKIDFFSPIEWKKDLLGTFDLPAGDVRMVVRVVGSNPKAEARHMFGLDYLLLEAK
jgi:hypothetical protein